jgi:hypothetical protein
MNEEKLREKIKNKKEKLKELKDKLETEENDFQNKKQKLKKKKEKLREDLRNIDGLVLKSPDIENFINKLSIIKEKSDFISNSNEFRDYMDEILDDWEDNPLIKKLKSDSKAYGFNLNSMIDYLLKEKFGHHLRELLISKKMEIIPLTQEFVDFTQKDVEDVEEEKLQKVRVNTKINADGDKFIKIRNVSFNHLVIFEKEFGRKKKYMVFLPKGETLDDFGDPYLIFGNEGFYQKWDFADPASILNFIGFDKVVGVQNGKVTGERIRFKGNRCPIYYGKKIARYFLARNLFFHFLIKNVDLIEKWILQDIKSNLEKKKENLRNNVKKMEDNISYINQIKINQRDNNK